MKRKRIAAVCTMVALLSALFVAPNAVQARWASGNEKYFTATRVCRDGAEVSAGVSPFTLPDPTPTVTRTIVLGANLYSDTTLGLPISGEFSIEADGPVLALPSALVMTYHATPLSADLDDDGTNDTDFQVYGSKTLRWSRQLNVGDRVVVHEPSQAYLTTTVADCSLSSLALNEGETMTVGNATLFPSDDLVPPAALRYRVDTPPAHGALKLNGAPLAAGGTFSQDDVNNNRLTYTHDGSETTSDSFNMSVSSTIRASVASDGTQANGASTKPSLSDDSRLRGGGSGRSIAFQSDATNLVSGDTNAKSDVFMRRLNIGITSRESVSTSGAQANDASTAPSLSPNGSNLAFETLATNLGTSEDCIPYGGIGQRQIFRRDMLGQTTRTLRSSVSSTVYSECYFANSDSFTPAAADNSGAVAFASNATNLLLQRTSGGTSGGAGNPDTNGVQDVFVHNDAIGGSTFLESLNSSSPFTQANFASLSPSITSDGDTVAFVSAATNLVSGDTNNTLDVYLRESGKNVRVSVSTAGAQAIGGGSSNPSISATGRYVAFASSATNLVSDDTNNNADIFVRDRDTDNDGTFDTAGKVSTTRVSVGTGGTQANGASFSPDVSSGGRYVVFASDATNLVNNDTNGKRDIFVYDRQTSQTTRVSVGPNGEQADGDSNNPVISADGSYIAFESDATNLASGDTNGQRDIFVRYTGFASTYPIAITPVNDAPTITPPANQTIVIGNAVGPLAFTVGDTDSPVESLTISASSSNQALIPDASIVLGGAGANRTIQFATTSAAITTPTNVTVTLTASDGAATSTASFTLTIQPTGPILQPVSYLTLVTR